MSGITLTGAPVILSFHSDLMTSTPLSIQEIDKKLGLNPLTSTKRSELMAPRLNLDCSKILRFPFAASSSWSPLPRQRLLAKGRRWFPSAWRRDRAKIGGKRLSHRVSRRWDRCSGSRAARPAEDAQVEPSQQINLHFHGTSTPLHRRTTCWPQSSTRTCSWQCAGPRS